MEGWQKLEILSKVAAALFIPLAIAYIGNDFASANKQRDTETKFVEIATAILSKEPPKDQGTDSKSLRKWAVAVIDRFSGVPMTEETAEALIKSTALPQTTPVFQERFTEPDQDATWGVVFGGDPTLAAAKDEVTRTAERMGIGQGTIFRRAGSFRSVRVYVSKSEAEDALGRAKSVRADAYLVNMRNWCPTSSEKEGYFECAAP